MIDLGNLTDDGKAQAVATLLSAALAIGGALLGAWMGARAGAKSTREAGELALKNALERDRIERHHIRAEALRALAFEMHQNADVSMDRAVMWYSVPFLTNALTQAGSYLADLPEDVSRSVRNAMTDVQRYNTLVSGMAVAQRDDLTRIRSHLDEMVSIVQASSDEAAAKLDKHLRKGPAP